MLIYFSVIEEFKSERGDLKISRQLLLSVFYYILIINICQWLSSNIIGFP